MKRFKCRIPAILMALVLSVGFAVPALAADQAFSFNQSNTGQTYVVYTGAYNNKVYSGNSATVKVTSNNAQGYGYAFRMAYKSGSNYYNATVTSPTYWVSGTGTVHPAYASGQNITNRNYYVAARFDDDYAGPYSCAGMFNSDYT